MDAAATTLRLTEEAQAHRQTKVTEAETARDGYATDITGIDSEIDAQIAIIEGDTSTDDQITAATTERERLEGVKAEKEALKAAEEAKLTEFTSAKADDDAASAGAAMEAA